MTQETEHNGVVAVEAAETSKDARQLLADITAGLERLDQAPWEVSHQNDDPEGGFRGVVSPHKTNRLGKQYRCYVAQYCSPDMAEHIARCDPDNMQTIDREFAALTLELASAKRRIAELEAERQWKPIALADKGIAYIHDMAGLRIGCSHPVWVRDEDGRIYEAIWSDDGKRAYWWDLEGESPVDPFEFQPHPLARAAFPASPHEGTQS